MRIPGRSASGLLALSLTVSVGIAASPAYQVIVYMNQLGQPAGVTEGDPQVFYSISVNPPHTAFSVTPQGVITSLASFANGDHIQSLLIGGANGRFYSTVEPRNGPARLFSVTSAADSKKLYAPLEEVPILTQSLPDGAFLGIAVKGDIWQLIKSGLDGNLTPLHRFPPGERLANTAIYAADGSYYGVSVLPDYAGYVYRVTPSGELTKLLSFPARTFGKFVGDYMAPLLQASDGNFYGVTPTGGEHGTGTIYKLTPGGRSTVLRTFPDNHSSMPTALIEASDGNLYGATLGVYNAGGHSQIFRITKTGQFTLLYAMRDLPSDGGCQCQLTQASDGAIYGTARVGGKFGGGAIFKLEAGLAKPAPVLKHFEPQSGAPGTKVLIWGDQLLGASIRFRGIPAANVSQAGSHYIWATVPAGASTGVIEAATPAGTAKTRAAFIIR